ncbi:MAG: 2,3-bisphosphoglycerate-independent phosphoglycerate mutase [Verrucomicrobiota bacterium]|jgi:2,3-bisphosphoglycerate-independent phosphoglycerate mutase|nr:2,3-bisphosphoglycerate-independent phosphoglycerate mutase [Verrucomicrobiota bacterium]
MRPVVLIIRDGWGINPREEGNSVFAAKTPVIDRLKTRYPWTRLACSGEAVGLPDGYQGSSEVGHLNMGAGRIVIQELKRIDDGLSTGELFKSPKWAGLIANWKKNNSTLHFMGLLQDEGVHAHQEHLFKLMRRARGEFPQGKIAVHPFLDGRDTPPRSTLEYLARLEKELEAVGHAVIGTVQGRYYAMDRSKNYGLTDIAYACVVQAEGRTAATAVDAVKESYDQDQTPDKTPMVDEYIPPYVIGGYAGMKDGDSVMHFNYRQDRAIQLTQAFVSDDYKGARKTRPAVTYLGFTRYWDEFTEYLLGAMGGDGGMDNLLGEVIARAGLRQLRIAETQKFRHVTSFFNGKSTKPSSGEEQVDVPSRFDPATFASHPEMEAYNVTAELLKRLENNPYAFVAVNYANCDMVGHTGDLAAATKAVEIVDENIGKLLPRLFELDAHILITADHGNAEQMKDYVTGMVKTSHTLNEVECFYVAKDSVGVKLAPAGKLSDVAPTVLTLLGLPIPKEMTAQNLVAGRPDWE